MYSPDHGGRLRQAAAHYGVPVEDWLDLSTGINPSAYPVPPIPATAWQRLPEPEDGLEQAARRYYGCRSVLPVPGSQAAIQHLPRLRAPGRVGVLSPCYAEHAAAWRRAGHAVEELDLPHLTDRLDDLDVAVVVNPCNPTGFRIPEDELFAWHRRLDARGGWLVVDEAFIDPTPECSLAEPVPPRGLVILRSLGKFFGLAGARVGFLLAEAALLQAFADMLEPWPVAGPSRRVAETALTDTQWQAASRQRLREQSARLVDLLERYGLAPSGHTALFAYVPTAREPALHDALAQQGILVRCFSNPAALRFGLPGPNEQWHRLERALQQVTA